MSDSIWNDPRITAYVLDELSEDERKQFETELEDDSELAAAVAEARNVTGRLEGLFAAESSLSLDDERRQTIVAGGSGGMKTTATSAADRERSWRTPLIALATAASFLLLVGGPILISRNGEMILGQAETESNAKVRPEELAMDGTPAADGRLTDEAEPMIAAVDSVSESREADTDDAFGDERLAGQKKETESLKRNIEAARSELAQTRESAKGLRPLSRESILDAPASARPAPEPMPEIANRPQVMEAAPESGYDRNGRYKFQSQPGPTAEVKQKQLAKQPSRMVVREQLPMLRGQTQQLGQEVSDLALVPTELKRNVPVEFYERRFESLSGGGFGDADSDGVGPGKGGDKFEPITDNPFKRVSEHAMSTFSVDVDTASYSKTREFLTRANRLPRPDAVRIEELINYFDYDYEPPTADDKHPFATHTVVTSCPWNDEHRLARIALKGKVMEKKERPRCNLVFLLDTSGSMNAPNKLPLVVEGMQMLLGQLRKKDRVAITVYAGSAGLVLDSTPAKKKGKIRKALTQLSAGGSTNGGAGIALAYQTARDHFIEDGVNRVILCTDGDFNVGTTGTDALVRMVEQEAKGGIFLSVLGFGMGNHNDAMLERISGRGNGNYAFIDNSNEARKVLVEQTNSTLVTIAKDVKLQIEFNPTKVSSYRLIGYENRILAKEDFNDDQKDAGEIGAGHAVTALYELVPAGVQADESRPEVDDLKYQSKPQPTDAADSNELMTLKLRYKQPDGDTSTLVEFPVTDEGTQFADADNDVRFAAAVAGFGMQLRRSEYKGSWTLSDVKRVAKSSKGEDESGLRTEFFELVQKASQLMGEE